MPASALGTVSVDVEACEEGFRIVMVARGPEGQEHRWDHAVAATEADALEAAAYLQAAATAAEIGIADRSEN